MTKTRYHVYAEDGFETSHRSLAAAKQAASRGARRNRKRYMVVQCSADGYTGAWTPSGTRPEKWETLWPGGLGR